MTLGAETIVGMPCEHPRAGKSLCVRSGDDERIWWERADVQCGQCLRSWQILTTWEKRTSTAPSTPTPPTPQE